MTLIGEPNLCSSASKYGTFRQEIRVRPRSTKSVPFIIIPMKDGEYPIEVKAAVKDSSLNDGIMKMLRVVVRETCHFIPLGTDFLMVPGCYTAVCVKRGF